ncbi:MAG TPA: cobalt-precorrin-5B (C(1))-methyltransferase, partial [Nitrospiria bacterium]|nr:cobalt-precorrin-5B (C(1))-methyltransferase [Nitrospiria bacterium]
MADARRKGMRTGYTTGACAAAAAKAATGVLAGGPTPDHVALTLPIGEAVTFPIAERSADGDRVTCGIVKDAGDDPDVTNRALIRATVSWIDEPGAVRLEAGEGVGVVTKPGLGLAVGTPDITRGPRKMITQAVTDAAGEALRTRGVRVV